MLIALIKVLLFVPSSKKPENNNAFSRLSIKKMAAVITNKIKNKKQTNQLISDLLQSYFFFNYFF